MDTNTRQAKRAPVTLKIKFKSATLDQFIERYAVDVSPGGIFIRTKEPLGVGTQMRFEFQLRDATPLITGEGTVVWTRENDPTRPAAAPGMGVRFDRLGDGSQAILDKILAEKAKQPAAQPVHHEGAPRGFLEVPTKVAPSPLVGALANESKPKLGNLSPSRGGFADERTDNTPLPRPMPFHSDAEEFPDEAFEEATKVRALDELVAATAVEHRDDDRPVKARPTPSAPMPAARTEPAPSVTAPSVPRTAPPSKPPPARAATPSSPPAPVSPLSDAAADGAHARPAPLSQAAAAAPPSAFSPFDESGEGQAAPVAVAEAPAARVRAPSAPPVAPAPAREEAPRLVPEPEREPQREKERSKPVAAPVISAPAARTAAVSAAPVPEPSTKGAAAVVVGLLLAGVVAAAVWFFVLRKTQTGVEPEAQLPTPATDVAVVVDAAATMVATVDAAIAVPAVETQEVEIKASVAGATVEVQGGASGAAPFKTELEKGKSYTIIVRADSHRPVTIEVKPGDVIPTVKLEPLPRSLTVTSTPPGAIITIDGVNTGKKTPASVPLTKAQVAARSVKLGLRRGGFAPFNKVIERDEFVADDAGESMTATLDATLTAVRTGGGDRPGTSASTPVDAGVLPPTPVDAGVPPPRPVDAGVIPPRPVDAGLPPPRPVDAPPAPKPVDAPKPPGGGTGTGTGTGTGEPTPDWMKP